MNILQVVVSKNIKGNKSSVTGPERRAANLANKWKKYGINVTICYPSSGSLNNSFKKAGLKVIDFRIKGKFDFKSIFKLKKIIIENKIELVHSQGGAALDLFVALAAKITGIPSVVTRPVMICDQIHYSKIKRKIYELIDQNITMKILDKVIAVSNMGSSILKNIYKVDDKKIVVIHNGVDLKKFDVINPNRKSFDKENKEIIIGMVGHLSPFKGWFDFIKIIKLIDEKSKFSIKALVIGDGILRDRLVNEVNNLNLSKTIIFTGYVENMNEILSKLDIFLFTTHREGLSVAVIEALSSSLPLVATDVGGIYEQVNNKENGFILSVGDIVNMSKKCLDLINDPELRFKMGKKSRAIAEKRFSEKRMLQEHVDCYKSILNYDKRLKK